MAAVPLLQLPSELLCLVWQQLRVEDGARTANKHQHALRCTCRAMRDVSSPFIEHMKLDVELYSTRDNPGAWGNAIWQLQVQLERFPKAAVLRSLHLCGDVDVGSIHSVAACLALKFGSRLAGLRRLVISGDLELTYGDMSAIADSCPELQQLTIKRTTLSIVAFRSLARLTSLDSLCIQDADASQGVNGLFDVLPPNLTSLDVQGLQEGDGVWDVCLGAAILAAVSSLSKLRSLTVYHHNDYDDYDEDDRYDGSSRRADLCSVAELRHLTQLEVDCSHFPRLPPGVQLACASCLVSLQLINTSLDAYAIKVTAAMPCLEYVEVYSLIPERDLHGLACGWQEVAVRHCSLQHIMRLPKSALECLTFTTLQQHWKLHSSDSMRMVCDQVRAASHAYAASWWNPQASGEARLKLSWDALPRYATGPVLAALRPLRRLQGLTLILSNKFWALDETHAQHLATSLPLLHTLDLCKRGKWDVTRLLRGLASASCPACLMLPGRAWSRNLLDTPAALQIKDCLMQLANAKAVGQRRLVVMPRNLLPPTDALKVEAAGQGKLVFRDIE